MFTSTKLKIKQWLVPNEGPRQKWIINNLKALDKGWKILDAGAGQQPYKKYCGHLHYFAQDFCKYKPGNDGLQIRDWKYGKIEYQGDVWNINEKDNFFDAVLCTEVLEHVPFPNETIREFSRLIKPGGILLLTAPYACLPHMQPYFFYSGFSQEYYKYMLKKNIFEIVEIEPNGNFFAYLLQEMVRGTFLLNNKVVKIFYLLFFFIPVLVMKILAHLSNDHQMVFGYHIRAVRK